MREYKISSSHSVSDIDIPNIIEEKFGNILSSDNNCYKVKNPINPTVDEIYIEIDTDELRLDITEKDISELKSNNLFSEVPDIIQAKNNFLRKVTGKTVSDRKQKWRKEVLPTESRVVRNSV